MVGRLLDRTVTSIPYSAFESWLVFEQNKVRSQTWILMVGRLLDRTASSIPFSAFESWLVFGHNKVSS